MQLLPNGLCDLAWITPGRKEIARAGVVVSKNSPEPDIKAVGHTIQNIVYYILVGVVCQAAGQSVDENRRLDLRWQGVGIR